MAVLRFQKPRLIQQWILLNCIDEFALRAHRVRAIVAWYTVDHKEIICPQRK